MGFWILGRNPENLFYILCRDRRKPYAPWICPAWRICLENQKLHSLWRWGSEPLNARTVLEQKVLQGWRDREPARAAPRLRWHTSLVPLWWGGQGLLFWESTGCVLTRISSAVALRLPRLCQNPQIAKTRCLVWLRNEKNKNSNSKNRLLIIPRTFFLSIFY